MEGNKAIHVQKSFHREKKGNYPTSGQQIMRTENERPYPRMKGLKLSTSFLQFYSVILDSEFHGKNKLF